MVSDPSLGMVSDICLADVANLCALSDTCPLSRSVSLLLTDTPTVADGKVTTLSDTPTEKSDGAPAARVEMSASCVLLSGLSATGARVSDRFWALGGVQSR